MNDTEEGEMAAVQTETNLTAGGDIDMDEYIRNQRSDTSAYILAIGTANPPHLVNQKDYPDYYFKVTRSEHLTELKDKFARICAKSKIDKRHFFLTEELLAEHPSITSYDGPSFDARQHLMVPAVPALGKEAAEKAIAEWAQPIGKITHLVFCSTSGVQMPGSDYMLIRAMGLNPSVKRVTLYFQGCMAGGTVLRIAKDIAENNRGARVLIVCSEITVMSFRGPRPDGGHIDNLTGQALFGDGAAAVIVGADPVEAERPWFRLLWAGETLLRDSHGSIEGHLLERGLTFHLMRNVPEVIAENVEEALADAFRHFGVEAEWNKLFWIVHPGGPAILDAVEAKLRLQSEKLRASRQVLREKGNMSSACVLFILDEMRMWSVGNGCSTSGEGLPFGVLCGFGPGLSMETVALQSMALH